MEVCNGIDDDGDTLVDEGSPDTDLDGHADCVDSECDPVPSPVGKPAAACVANPSRDPWDLVVEDSLQRPVGAFERLGVAATPVVTLLDEASPEIIVPLEKWPWETSPAALRWTPGTEPASLPNDSRRVGGIAAADLDLDGTPEIVITRWNSDGSIEVAAMSLDGRPIWAGKDPGPLSASDDYPVTVDDLDGDGSPEVVTACAARAGRSGTVVGVACADGRVASSLAMADLDGDGSKEILAGSLVLDGQGEVLWKAGSWPFTSTLPVQADEGRSLEVAVFAEHYELRDARGALVQPVVDGPADAIYSLPCVGDLDGDGSVEIAFTSAGGDAVAMGLDGTIHWLTAAPEDTEDGRESACSTWDPDGDGSFDVLFLGTSAFWVIEGRTGETLFVDPDYRHDFRANGHHAAPIIADVDGDGSAEVVASASSFANSWDFVRVYGPRLGSWPNSEGTWGALDHRSGRFTVGNRVVPSLDEGAPAVRAVLPAHAPPRPDYAVQLVEGCASSCDSGRARTTLRARVTSDSADVEADVALVALDRSGRELARRSATVGGAPWEVEFADLPTAGPVVLELEVDDCDSTDDTVTWVGWCD